VVIAAISAKPDSYSGAYALAAMLLYSLRLYANFSGTMDVVLGLSQMLGLKLSENFDTPYLSQSFQEFWRRWHITLGDWLKNYIYIPLGGNRKGKIRKYLNLIVTFLVSGIWHGGEYLLWGMRIKTPGLREPFQMLVQVSPDGKDFNLLSKQMLDVSEEWKAVQNYRWLVSSLSHGPRPLLESLGFTPVITDNLTDISYDTFEASMLSIMTQKLYDAHWADYFWEQDGKLAIHEDFGGGEDRYLVESVQVQEDGTVLSHEFCHDFADEFTVYTVQAELEELPNGSFRVSAWNADNADLMAKAETPAPQN
jgi:hypothetical protein